MLERYDLESISTRNTDLLRDITLIASMNHNELKGF